MKKIRVVVAMSGGVDSSVAAALLKEQGYEVIGITMCFNLKDADRKKPACCGIQGIEDARRVCHKLGIKHYVLNMQKALNEYVIKDFLAEYASGRTPNPCVRCNQYLKFDHLLKKALSLDAKYLATGHYVRIAKIKDGLQLKKAKDLHKDQSYFLYRLSQNQLKHLIFPLGGYTKTQVRELARKFGLAVADKVGSQEICFLPEVDYRPFIKSYLKDKIRPGEIVDKKGNVLGSHKGVAFYTIGQREGLGVALGYPVYITKIDPKTDELTLGAKEDVLKKQLLVKDAHFIAKPIKKKVVLKVRIRYNHKEAAAEVVAFKNKLKITFKHPQFAITPGQSAVFYSRDKVLGGGIIERALD
ncbi:MAG: tRNA 2-thiouridine(34) synthase MnmA [Candidatus Omnitrophica bacterium]|nr:tRNA 2-thiouridine(34) synthase MnmA [Candidatus Omnitrophota bacterium]